MNDKDMTIGVADGTVDVARLVEDIRTRVNQRMAEGAYTDPRIARAERMNLSLLGRSDEFFSFYVTCMREAILVDINDFDIRERRRFGSALVLLKKVIWGLLKFYTYRLWSQQNQINAMLLTAIEESDRKYQGRIAALEERLKKLEHA